MLLYSYTPPASPEDALKDTINNTSFVDDYATAAEAVKEFASGPRILSSSMLSHLTIARLPAQSSSFPSSSHDSTTPRTERVALLLAAAHYAADAGAIHMSLNKLLVLLGSPDLTPYVSGSGDSPRSEERLTQLVIAEWTARWGRGDETNASVFSVPAEAALGYPWTKLQATANAVDHHILQSRHIVSTYCLPLFSLSHIQDALHREHMSSRERRLQKPTTSTGLLTLVPNLPSKSSADVRLAG